jgi:nitrate reductase gamma subunit
MLKVLKLQKAIYITILGVLALVASQIMSEHKVDGSNVVLGISGALLIIGALLFIYPILFAKKVDTEGEKVALKPIGDELVEEEHLGS